MVDKFILVLSLFVIAAGFLVLFSFTKPNITGMVGDVHNHIDMKLYIHNQAFNFSNPKYMSTDNHSLSPFVHLHDMEGGVVHQHIRGVTLTMFFKSINMSINSSCLMLDDGSQYCTNEHDSLKFYVQPYGGDWFRTYDIGSYELQDLDRVLISYGSENDVAIKKQQDSVSTISCMYSEKCPEKGTLGSNESSCVGQNGSCSS